MRIEDTKPKHRLCNAYTTFTCVLCVSIFTWIIFSFNVQTAPRFGPPSVNQNESLLVLANTSYVNEPEKTRETIARGEHAKNMMLKSTNYKLLGKRSTLGAWPKYLENFKNPCWFHVTSNVEGIRCLPLCYILGVAKSGTTSLFKQLTKHPDVATPSIKEGIFMQNDTSSYPFQKYLTTFIGAAKRIYKQQNSTGYHKMVTLDANPLLFTSASRAYPQKAEPNCTMADALYSINPGAKLIVTMRNPTDRLFSHYHQTYTHRVRDRKVSGGFFHNHTLKTIDRMENCLANRSLRSCLFDEEFYEWQLKQKVLLHAGMYHPYAVEWLSVFPRNQILFVNAEELYSNAVTVMQEVFAFLGLSHAPAKVMKSIADDMRVFNEHESALDSNQKSYRMKMWNETRALVDKFYSPYNVKLAELLADEKWLFEKRED